MSDLTHLFKVGQAVVCVFDGEKHNGTVTETAHDFILVDIPTISDHCCFERGMLDMVHPVYNFN